MKLDNAFLETQTVRMSQIQTLSDRAAAGIRAEMGRQRKGSADLAKVLHVGQRAAFRRMKGELPFSLNEVEKVSAWLGVTYLELLAVRERPAVPTASLGIAS